MKCHDINSCSKFIKYKRLIRNLSISCAILVMLVLKFCTSTLTFKNLLFFILVQVLTIEVSVLLGY